MPVSIIGTPQAIQEGGTYTAETGSDRLLVVAGTGESAFSSRPLLGLTIGGVAMTEVVYTGNNRDPKGGVYYIKESQIPAGALTLVANWNGEPHNNFVGAAYTLGGVDQTTPVAAFASAIDDGTTTNAADATLTTVNNSVLIAGGGTYSINQNFNLTNTNAASTRTLTQDARTESAGHEGVALSTTIATGASDTVGFRAIESGQVVVTAANFAPAVTTTAGISTKTLERLGVGVSATAADVFVWSGHNVDMVTTAADHKVLGATITASVLQQIDLSSTSITVGGNITVVVIPATGGPGIAIETTAEDIA